MFCIGDVFKNNSSMGHYWAIISITGDAVLLVNWSSYKREKEKTCILSEGDHPAIEHNSNVMYKNAQAFDFDKLKCLLREQSFKKQISLKFDVLNKIRCGAIRSTNLNFRLKSKFRMDLERNCTINCTIAPTLEKKCSPQKRISRAWN